GHPANLDHDWINPRGVVRDDDEPLTRGQLGQVLLPLVPDPMPEVGVQPTDALEDAVQNLPPRIAEERPSRKSPEQKPNKDGDKPVDVRHRPMLAFANRL